MPEKPGEIRIITYAGSEFEGTWINFADFQAYLDAIRSTPEYAADVEVLDKLEEALVGSIVSRQEDEVIDLGG